MGSLARLLLFCNFLENRLHTSSLLLLRRMFADFYAGNEHTLHDFMRLGAAVVTVMPKERKGPRHVKEAARLLTEQKGDNVSQETEMDPSRQNETSMDPSVHQQEKPCVFRYLSARVATTNILWLRDMLQEFCNGEDATLREFLRRGNAAISVIPVDIQALCMAPLPPPPLMAETTLRTSTMPSTGTSPQVTSSPALSPQRKRSRGSEQEQQDGGEEAGADTRTRKQVRRVSAKEAESATRFEPDPSSLTADDVRSSIISAFERLEAKEPWKQAFNLYNLSMPFSRVRYPKLAATLQEFWQHHARAVWERKFWAPLSRLSTRAIHNQRRCRQCRAIIFFEKKIIRPVYNELGATFFVEMDQRSTPPSGWFYSNPAVDLFSLAQRHGLSTCLQYMESETFKRFPVVPGESRNFWVRANGKSRSMWSSSPALRSILNEIVAVKAKTNNSSPSAKR